MANMSCGQLRQKDVINLCDGTKLGNVIEIEFDSCSGQICTFSICKPGGILGFSKDKPLVIPWRKIECIGEDAVLIKIPASELDCYIAQKKHNLK